MQNHFGKLVGIVLATLIIVTLPAVSLGQDRDITEGSSSGSIRSDVSERPSGPRTRMLTPDKRAGLVAEFELFNGSEKLLNAPSFAALQESYRIALEKVAAEKPIATNLTPLKYLTFELVAKDLSRKKPGVNADQLADAIISAYVKTKDFMPPILAAGFTEEEARKAQSDAVAALRQLVRQRRLVQAQALIAAPSNPAVGTVTIIYGVTLNDRPRRANAGSPKRKGTLGVTIRIAPRFVFGITNDTFSSKKRADGTYITGIGNTTPSLKFEALDDNKKHPSLSFAYSITLPTASVAKTLGSGRVDHKIVADFGKKVETTSLGLSVGYLFSGRKDAPGFTKTFLGAISLGYPINDKFTSKNEIDFATKADTNPSEIYAINQIVYKVNDTFSLRAGVRTGITPYTPRIGFIGGITINTHLSNIFK